MLILFLLALNIILQIGLFLSNRTGDELNCEHLFIVTKIKNHWILECNMCGCRRILLIDAET